MSGGDRADWCPAFPPSPGPVQANMLTGKLPRRARRHRQRLLLARQAGSGDVDRLEREDPAPQIWDLLHQHDPQLTSAVWFPMLSKGCGADYICMPAPIHNPDGSESLWCYTKPTELYGTLRDTLGHFPLMHFWGPLANIKSPPGSPTPPAYAMQQFRPELLLHLSAASRLRRPAKRARQSSRHSRPSPSSTKSSASLARCWQAGVRRCEAAVAGRQRVRHHAGRSRVLSQPRAARGGPAGGQGRRAMASISISPTARPGPSSIISSRTSS